MKKLKLKNEKGITLVALVVTIIVLLILAGISISMLSGDNGILQKATDAKTFTERASVVEQAKTDVLGYQTENKGTDLQKSQLQSVLETYFKSVPDLTDMSDTEILNTELETLAKYGTHNITVKEIFDGSFSDENEDSLKKSVAELREGDEVIYTDGNGNTIPCIVLYDSTGSYGIQIISKDTVGTDIELGNGTGNASTVTDSDKFLIAKQSYNTAIANLNNMSKNYINTQLATNARCVGSSPSMVPVTNEDNAGTYTNEESYFSSPVNYNNQFKEEDTYENVSNGDYEQMKKKNINCYDIGKKYWLASRDIYDANYQAVFSIRYSDGSSSSKTQDLCTVFASTPDNIFTLSKSNAYGLRPIFILNPNIYYIQQGENKLLVN